MTENHGQSLSDANAQLSNILQHIWQDDLQEMLDGDEQIGALMGGNRTGEPTPLYLPLDADLLQHWQPAATISSSDLLMVQLLRVLQKAFSYEPIGPESTGTSEPATDPAESTEPVENNGTGATEELERANGT